MRWTEESIEHVLRGEENESDSEAHFVCRAVAVRFDGIDERGRRWWAEPVDHPRG